MYDARDRSRSPLGSLLLVLVCAAGAIACGDDAAESTATDGPAPDVVEVGDAEPSHDGSEGDAVDDVGEGTPDADVPPRPDYDPAPPTSLGGERPARVVLPRGYDPAQEDYPLVMMLHGYGATAAAQDFVFGLGARVDRFGFILITPEGTVDGSRRRFWNATEVCCDFAGSGIDDASYLAGLLEEAIALYAVDRARVALVGHSNGGFMSYRMACERPDLVRSIGVLAGSTFRDEALCRGVDPVSVLHMHGTDDDTVAYAQDRFSMGAEISAARWATKAGCDPALTEVERRDYFAALDGDETLVMRHEACPDEVEVEVWRIDGGDHILLGNNDAFKDALVDFLLRPRSPLD
jgi:polyhydroxybutyrate depolymerase